MIFFSFGESLHVYTGGLVNSPVMPGLYCERTVESIDQTEISAFQEHPQWTSFRGLEYPNTHSTSVIFTSNFVYVVNVSVAQN